MWFLIIGLAFFAGIFTSIGSSLGILLLVGAGCLAGLKEYIFVHRLKNSSADP